jgi:UDP-galactopyranose mutase
MNIEVDYASADLVCFSHLRWNFVFQRPQHLMSRFAALRRVFFIEEPMFEDVFKPELRQEVCPNTGVRVCTPLLPRNFPQDQTLPAIKTLIKRMFRSFSINQHIQWFYTPMALDWCPDCESLAVIYDCMDELSLFLNAPPALRKNEQKLLSLCDLVFTGGISLFESKRKQHQRVYPFPSSVDVPHFSQARSLPDSVAEQKSLPKPRLGYTGVIDERIDLNLIQQMADERPDWQFIMIGPVVKIDADSLPQRQNIHWLGPRPYEDLPKYLAGWDIALMPFQLNDATRFISPTKTPEYLAAGLPVISTAVRDVVRQYGAAGLVHIATEPAEFVAAAQDILTYGRTLKLQHRIDAYLQTLSWDQTWSAMSNLIEETIKARDVSREKDRNPVTQTPKVMAAGQLDTGYV